MRAFKLLKPMPGLDKGLVFVYDQFNESRLGSNIYGCLILGWDDGNCQSNYDTNSNWAGGWCGGAFVLPGQLSKSSEWFEEIQNPEISANSSHSPKPHRYYITMTKHTSVTLS
jgi:hypothetical protein